MQKTRYDVVPKGDEWVVEAGGKSTPPLPTTEGEVGFGTRAITPVGEPPADWAQFFTPHPETGVWGEPYTEIAKRMTAALHRARVKAAGHEAVCVSHQLPVETLRRAMTKKPLHHFPTHRLCNLASLTSFYFHGDTYVGWGYAELAGQ